MSRDSKDVGSDSGGSQFMTTRWTEVLATRGDGIAAREALGALCGLYYGPVVAFLRHEGRSEEEARELAHAFFERLLQSQGIDGADPSRGRFRSYLLGALKHFLANRRAHEAREIRGGGAVHVPLDRMMAEGESQACFEPAALPAPDDAVFDRAWALRVLERGLSEVEKEFVAAGTAHEFALLKPWLIPGAGGDGRRREEVAIELGLGEGALRTAVHRLRRRFREVIKAEIRSTVLDPAEVDAELQHLIRALSVTDEA
ncbi:MAG: sigma-70 family RNA polymerase sigma factor [Verrucomicrobiales bacterium]|nr:sigma-70 family RNA polymerase sigma factor [Verrucomicrobiales bacterium]